MVQEVCSFSSLSFFSSSALFFCSFSFCPVISCSITAHLHHASEIFNYDKATKIQHAYYRENIWKDLQTYESL